MVVSAMIISSLLNLGSVVGMGLLQQNENKKARNEARGIAEQNRQDTLNQRSFNNSMSRRQLGLNDQRLAHDTQMVEEGFRDANQQKMDLEQNRDQEHLTQSVNRLREKQDDRFINNRSIAQRRFV